jgi:hypothetical protein
MAKIIDTSELDSLSLSPDENHWVYNGLDNCLTLEIFNELSATIDDTARRTYEFSLALQAPVLEMNMRGVLVNQNRRRDVIRDFERKQGILEAQLSYLLGEVFDLRGFNWASPLQVKNLLYGVMQLPVQKKRNANGIYAPSSDREALEALSFYYIAEPIINHILGLRDLGKSLGFLRTPLDSDGRLRTSFNIAGTVTGRFSSSADDFDVGTNLQNITESLRSVFVADPGYKFANLDLEQGDSRNVGAICWELFHESHGETFAGAYLDACESGDLHTIVTKMVQPQLPWGTMPDKQVAEMEFYRGKSYRDGSKKLGHGCLTEDHEVLTRNGWVPITDKPEEILTWKDNRSEFQQVQAWTDKPYTGKLHRFSGNSQDVRMTADHRVPYITEQRRPITRVRPAELGPQAFMPLGSGWVGGNEVVPAKLIAATMADGYIEKNWTAFHFHKQRKVNRIKLLCEEYGITYKIHGDKIRVAGNYPKHPGPFMFNWTADCLKQFVDELKYWDGHRGKTSVSIHSSIRKELEWYQTFGRILGVGGAIQKPQTSGFGTRMYTLQQNNRQYANGGSSYHERIEVENVRVLCPTVPASFFYVRRNGKISVTGNSNYLGQPGHMAKQSKFPIANVKEFQAAYFGAFPCIPAWHKNVFWKLSNLGYIETLFGDRRVFFGRPEEAATRREAVAHAPQSMTGKEINIGILNLWRANRVQLLIQVHDSILFQFPEEQEDEIIPWALEALKAPLTLSLGREFVVPTEAKVGWTWGNHSDTNPDGLIKWKGSDPRTRTETRFKPSIL